MKVKIIVLLVVMFVVSCSKEMPTKESIIENVLFKNENETFKDAFFDRKFNSSVLEIKNMNFEGELLKFDLELELKSNLYAILLEENVHEYFTGSRIEKIRYLLDIVNKEIGKTSIVKKIHSKGDIIKKSIILHCEIGKNGSYQYYPVNMEIESLNKELKNFYKKIFGISEDKISQIENEGTNIVIYQSSEFDELLDQLKG